MTIRFQCAGCGKSFHVKDESAGKLARCPTCDTKTRVPVSTDDLDSTRTYVPVSDDEFRDFDDGRRPKARRRSKGKKRAERRWLTKPANRLLIGGGVAGVVAAALIIVLMSRSNDVDKKPDTPTNSRKTDSDPPQEAAVKKPPTPPEKRPDWKFQNGERLPWRFAFLGRTHHSQYAFGLHGVVTTMAELISTAAWSSDGRYVAAQTLMSATSHQFQIFDLRNRRPVGDSQGSQRGCAILDHPDEVYDSAFSPNGKTLATASGKYFVTKKQPFVHRGSIHFWDSATGKSIGKPLRFPFVVRRVLFSPDGKLLVASASNRQPLPKAGQKVRGVWELPKAGSIHIFDAKTLKRRFPPLPHLGQVHVIEFTQDGKYLLSAGGIDRNVKVWDVTSGKLHGQPLRTTAGVLNAGFADGGKFAVAATFDGKIHVWDVARGKLLASRHAVIPAPADPLRSSGVVILVSSPIGARIATVNNGERKVRLWQLPSLKPIGSPISSAGVGPNLSTNLKFSPDGKLLLTAGIDGVVQFWSAASAVKIRPPNRWLAISSLMFSRDGRSVLTVGGGGAQLWRIPGSE